MIEHNPWNPITQFIVRRCRVDKDAHLLTASQAARLARGAGLDMIEASHFLYLPERMFRRMKWIEDSLRFFPLGGQFGLFCRKLDA